MYTLYKLHISYDPLTDIAIWVRHQFQFDETTHIPTNRNTKY